MSAGTNLAPMTTRVLFSAERNAVAPRNRGSNWYIFQVYWTLQKHWITTGLQGPRLRKAWRLPTCGRVAAARIGHAVGSCLALGNCSVKAYLLKLNRFDPHHRISASSRRSIGILRGGPIWSFPNFAACGMVLAQIADRQCQVSRDVSNQV